MLSSLTMSRNLLLRLPLVQGGGGRRCVSTRSRGMMVLMQQQQQCQQQPMMRATSASGREFHSSSHRTVKISFKEESSGDVVEMDAEEGKTVLDIAMDHKIDIEGACGGELACSTCHVLLPQEYYDRLGGAAALSEEEEDMLDLAWGVTDRSRLGCQICISPQLEGVQFVVPSETNSML